MRQTSFLSLEGIPSLSAQCGYKKESSKVPPDSPILLHISKGVDPSVVHEVYATTHHQSFYQNNQLLFQFFVAFFINFLLPIKFVFLQVFCLLTYFSRTIRLEEKQNTFFIKKKPLKWFLTGHWTAETAFLHFLS